LAFHQLGRLFSDLTLAHLRIVAAQRSDLGLSESRNDVAATVSRLNSVARSGEFGGGGWNFANTEGS
jgi:hypothetical protein